MKYLLFLLFVVGSITAQTTSKWDTTYYQKFRSRIIVGVFQTYRNFDNNFTPLHGGTEFNAPNLYTAESRLITGLELNYDKFSVAFGIRSKPQEGSFGKENTKTFNTNVNFGGNVWFLENTIRSFSGFYDENTQNYDSAHFANNRYYFQPNFTNFLFRSKFLYFTNNRKYSFRANYICNYRQLKSSATWILSANTNYNYMHNDSSFFPLKTRPAYLDYQNMSGLKSFGLSVNAGGAFTLVIWRAFFVHIMFIVGPEQQFRSYHYSNKPNNTLSYISISGDLRSSFGCNFKKAYFLWTTVNDFVHYNNKVMRFQNKSLAGSFIFGWRFHTKTPKFYQNFQKTKLYNSL